MNSPATLSSNLILTLSALIRSSLSARQLQMPDHFLCDLRRGAIAVEGRDLAACDQPAALAMSDRIGEIEGEERAVEVYHQIGGLVIFDYRDIERLKILPIMQRDFERFRSEVDRV